MAIKPAPLFCADDGPAEPEDSEEVDVDEPVDAAELVVPLRDDLLFALSNQEKSTPPTSICAPAACEPGFSIAHFMRGAGNHHRATTVTNNRMNIKVRKRFMNFMESLPYHLALRYGNRQGFG